MTCLKTSVPSYGIDVSKNQFHNGTELEFLKRLWGPGTGEEEGYRTGPPGYIGWRNSFLGIDSGAPYTFKNTSSDFSQGNRIRGIDARGP